MDGKNDWRPGPTVCRCCLSEGCYKDISTEYFWMGKKEVYADMLLDTFELTIQYAQTGGPNSQSRLICEPCISRLRDAADFKRQVKECEQTFLHYLNPSTSINVEVPLEPLEKEPVKIETVKQETALSDDDDFGDNAEYVDDDDDLDDEPLMNLATKVPKKESVDVMDLIDNNAKAEKRKASTKSKASPAKKAKVKEAKPTASKPKPEKKKKEFDWFIVARHNAKVVLKYSTAYPFRLPNHTMVCVYCCDSFDSPQEYRLHMNSEHVTFNVKTAFAHIGNNYTEFIKADCSDLKCRLCAMTFDMPDELAQHLVVLHNKDIKTEVEVGMQIFKLGKSWVCALCNEKQPTIRALSRHTSKHYHKYTCETCGKSYVNGENLNRHRQFGHTDAKICVKCKKVFPNTQARRDHVIASEKCWLFRCPNCGMRFINRKAKLEHNALVHGQAQKTYTCPECSMVFDKWSPYRAHFVLSHTSNMFTCAYCDVQFDNKRALREHIVSHTKEKAFPCQVCSKTFSRKKNLIQHSWIHSDVKRFDCKLCNKQFNQRVSWKTHMKSHHPELVDF